MFENITKHIPLTTLIVSYFFICGGLYLSGFWGTFDIDITNFISLTDIPKSFIFPFFVSQGFTLLYSAINTLISYDLLDNDSNTKKWEPVFWKRLLKYIVSVDFIILVSLLLFMHYFREYKLSAIFWLITTIWFLLILPIKIMSIQKIKELIPYYGLRLYIINTILFIPIISFSIGKIQGITVYNNSSIKYVKVISDQKQTIPLDTLPTKFIGFLGNKLIISSLDNKTMIYINESSFDRVKIEDKK